MMKIVEKALQETGANRKLFNQLEEMAQRVIAAFLNKKNDPKAFQESILDIHLATYLLFDPKTCDEIHVRLFNRGMQHALALNKKTAKQNKISQDARVSFQLHLVQSLEKIHLTIEDVVIDDIKARFKAAQANGYHVNLHTRPATVKGHMFCSLTIVALEQFPI